MAVLVKITNQGASLAMYDQIAPRLMLALKDQVGFHMHAAFVLEDGGGFGVHEVWDSRDQHEAWYDSYIRPNIPPDAQPQIAYVELHSLVTR